MQSLPSTSNPAFCDLAHDGPQTPAEEVFTQLQTLLGTAKVAALWGTTPLAAVKAEWDKALSGLERQEIARGLASCRRLVFAPNLGEFLRLCRPALDPEFAWFEAQAGLMDRDAGKVGEWSHPAVYRAAVSMPMEVRGGDIRQHRKRWEYALDREFRKGWLTGVPQPALAIAQSKAKTRPPTEAERAALASLRVRCFSTIAQRQEMAE